MLSSNEDPKGRKEPRAARPVDELSSEERERLVKPSWKALVRESLEYKRAHPNIELTRVTKSRGSVTKRIYPESLRFNLNVRRSRP